MPWLAVALVSWGLAGSLDAPASPSPPSLGGIYPHLAMFNDENECGTGAVVPWADRLWVVTYAPHQPRGSTDKLHEITPDLRQIIRPESIGGTPANRMIHRESRQLFIGPYAIDDQRRVRVIPYAAMFGRPTGNARHLVDPARKIYCASMEEGLYEIDVHSLAVTELWRDEQLPGGRHAGLPGYHGKGLYSGQGRLVYANNGEHGPEAQQRPDVPSGALASWDGAAAAWTVVRRNQFTEVTGPGGLDGNPRPDVDPIWSIGWDHRSLILMVLHGGAWHAYRLPKSSHSYDGAHGWNTEWPRIREIGERDLLMTMHGAFWRFPRDFTPGRSAGLRPISNYLKVIGDFARWNDRLVFGCDDTARAEFLNRRRAKGSIPAPQSQSNLWFVDPDDLDDLGPVLARGGPWVHEDVPSQTVTEPFLAAGFDRRWLHLAHGGPEARVTLELDRRGNGQWETARVLSLPAGGYLGLPITEQAAWLRLRADTALSEATAWFEFSNRDRRGARPARRFDGLATPTSAAVSGGLLWARADNHRTLAFAAVTNGPAGPRPAGYYELDAQLRLRRVEDPATDAFVRSRAAIPSGIVALDPASVLYLDDRGRRWRLPRGGGPAFDHDGPLGPARLDREVATERDLFHCHGTFYELPAENAGGFAKVRPVATHPFRLHDFCSYRGLLVLSGLDSRPVPANPHVLTSDDRRVALWAGALDDLWKLGKPRGVGGPWLDASVRAQQPSDPYLLAGYDRKTLALRHDQVGPVEVRIELDLTGDGDWRPYRSFAVPPGATGLEHEFPTGLNAYWLRAIADRDTRATAQLVYR